MWLTLFGFALALMPFVALVCFESRLKGLLSVFAITSVFHLSVALMTQALGVFSYGVILSLNLIFALVCVALATKRKRTAGKIKFDWFALASFGVIFLFLFSLHYFYTGPVSKTIGTSSVSQSSYPYPFYSDEWVAVSLIDYSIENKSLPLANPLNADKPFSNPLVGFHSLVAEIFVLLNLAPLTHYAWLAILNGVLVCAGIYLLLRLSKAGRFASAVSAMSAPFITNAGNLASIWYLMPFSLSLLFLLSSIIGFLLKSRLILFLSILVSFAVYPPMLVFIVPLVFGMFLSGRKEQNAKLFPANRLIVWLAVFFIAIAFAVVWIKIGSFAGVLDLLARERASGGIVSFALWDVAPVFLLPFMALGLWDIFKRRINHISFPIIVGGLFWVTYNFLLFDFIIVPPRIVAITTIFLVIAAGFGIERLYRYLRDKHSHVLKYLNVTSFKINALLAFILFAMFFSRISPWKKLTLVVKDDSGIQKHIPAPPVTRYLAEKDLELFAGVKGKRFIAPSWKGLVIGVATHNYPLDSKASTITNKMLRYDDFMEADCAQKAVYAEKFKIDYAYTSAFSCPSFKEIDKSEENLILYEVK